MGLNFRRYETTVLLSFTTYKHPAAALSPGLSCPAETKTVFFFYFFITSVNKATAEKRRSVVAPAEGGKKE